MSQENLLTRVNQGLEDIRPYLAKDGGDLSLVKGVGLMEKGEKFIDLANEELSQALFHFKQVMLFEPDNYTAQLLIGTVYHNFYIIHERFHYIDRAIEATETAINMNPQYDFAKLQLAELFVKRGNNKDGICQVVDSVNGGQLSSARQTRLESISNDSDC